MHVTTTTELRFHRALPTGQRHLAFASSWLFLTVRETWRSKTTCLCFVLNLVMLELGDLLPRWLPLSFLGVQQKPRHLPV